MCHAMTTVREPFSPQFSSSLKGQIDEECLLHNVQCWELKSWSFPDTWNHVSRKVLVADALRDRLPPSQLMVINAVDIDMSCFLPTSYQMPLRFANTCNDKEIFWLPPKMSPTVAITKFLFDWCEGLIHPSSFAKELLFSLRKDWTFSQTEGSSHSSSNPARKHIAGRRDTCSSSMSCPSICEAIQITSIASTEERAQMQVSASDHCEGTICFRVSKLAKDQINEECLFRKSLGCWCCCVTNHFGWCSRLWQEWAQHAALPGFHNRSMYDIVQSFRSSLSFKRHFCYHRVNGSCWVQVAGGSSSGHSIFVTSREWWYILNEIKEAYRVWAIL